MKKIDYAVIDELNDEYYSLKHSIESEETEPDGTFAGPSPRRAELTALAEKIDNLMRGNHYE